MLKPIQHPVFYALNPSRAQAIIINSGDSMQPKLLTSHLPGTSLHLKFIKMRALILSIAILAIAFSSIAQTKPFTMNDLPLKWTEVTELDPGNWVVFQPCDVPNGSVEMSIIKGKRKIVAGLGHEAVTFAVSNVRTINKTTIQFIGSYELVEPKRTDTVEVQYDVNTRRGRWKFPFGEVPYVSIYAPDEDLSKYKEVIQPCKECWEDCPDEPAQRAQQASTSQSFEGVYNTDPKKEGYWQRLSISKAANNTYNVEISFGGSKKGCSFKGTGELKNGRIEIQLSKVNKEMKGLMTIDKKADHMEVFTSNEDDRFELMWFCGGGASLAGDYYPEK
jgi:hypothetical protein